MKLVIFDFDGTIADTFSAIVGITNRLSTEFGYLPSAPDDVAQLQNLTSRQIIKLSKISILKLPFLLRRVRSEMEREMSHLHPFPGIPDALRTLQVEGYQLAIVTSNSQENVQNFLKIHQIDPLFNHIYSGATLFGKHHILRQCLRQQRTRPESAVYVGDETRDIEAARKSKLKVISVSWGYNSADILLSQKPDRLITQPEELLTALRELSYSPSN